MINPKTKGAGGERELCDMMNADLVSVMKELGGYSDADIVKAWNSVQRNQNQSAVGGNDLSNTFGLSIEVKRQEQLSVNTWWKQCVAAAERNKEIPILVYRQNRKPWRVVMNVLVATQYATSIVARGEMDIDVFREYWRLHVMGCLKTGKEIRS